MRGRGELLERPAHPVRCGSSSTRPSRLYRRRAAGQRPPEPRRVDGRRTHENVSCTTGSWTTQKDPIVCCRGSDHFCATFAVTSRWWRLVLRAADIQKPEKSRGPDHPRGHGCRQNDRCPAEAVRIEKNHRLLTSSRRRSAYTTLGRQHLTLVDAGHAYQTRTALRGSL